jgi:hypothetical protein
MSISGDRGEEPGAGKKKPGGKNEDRKQPPLASAII